MRTRFSLPVLFLLLLLVVGVAAAQVTSGNIAGSVKDASGAVIPGATLKVTNEQTGVATTITANNSGEFIDSNLPAGSYSVEVTATGFQAYKLNRVEVDLNKTSTANVVLSVGTATSVEVSADSGVVLDTTSTNLSQSFSTTELSELPTATVGFGVLNTALLSPGVASTGGIGIGEGPSVGGQRPRNNNFTIEGIDNNDKGVTGPLVYIPNDSVGSFTLITSQFSPEFGHSSGGQFNTNVLSGTNNFHGRLWEYFDNKELNAESGVAGGKLPNERYDFNRYGGQLGGPIFKDKLFFFGSFERQTTGQSLNGSLCVPTADGLATLAALGTNPAYSINANNLTQFLKYIPAANYLGGAQVTADNDLACFNQGSASAPQFATIYSGNQNVGNTPYAGANDNNEGTVFGSGASTNIPLGNYRISAPTFTNFDALTTSMDYILSSKDSIRGRYLYNTEGTQDTAASLPVFYTTLPFRFHLVALSEYHTFTPNLTNEFRVGYNRYQTAYPEGNFAFPGLSAFPNLFFNDLGLGDQSLGPDGNAPQSTVQNLYQVTDNISYIKGKHTIKIGFDGRKYISPQTFTQRVRGDYEYDYLTEYLQDVAPTYFGERSTGDVIYYGDQTALYGYANDTWRITPTVTINAGLRYEFTSVPVGERSQVLNQAASVPGLINFGAPQPDGKNFAPRVGINYAPDAKTSVRAGFGIAYDVLFDNLGLLSFPPQYSSTNDVGTGTAPNPGDPGFLAAGGLPSGGSGIALFCLPTTGGATGVPCQTDVATQQSKTSAFVPNVRTPYAETYTLDIQRTIGSSMTAEIGYRGTRGIHLPTQDQLNVQPRVNANNQLFTNLTPTQTLVAAGPGATNLGDIKALSNIIGAYHTCTNCNPAPTDPPSLPAAPNGTNFTSKITSYQPFSSSNYNGLIANLQQRMTNGLQLNLSYTWSKTMDDATDEVFATTLTPRRPQNSQNVNADYSRSALDRTHRITLEAVYDLPFYKHSSNFLMKNLVGNWLVSPIYTYESPEYTTVLSGVNSNLNGDSGSISRTIINPTGVKGTSSTVTPVTDGGGNVVGYTANNPNAYYIQAGAGTLPNASRNTLPIRPIDNVDLAASKRITFFDHYNFEFGAQALNVLNHAQYIPGSIDGINAVSYTGTAFQTVNSAAFNQPQLVFANNARSLQLSARIIF